MPGITDDGDSAFASGFTPARPTSPLMPDSRDTAQYPGCYQTSSADAARLNCLNQTPSNCRLNLWRASVRPSSGPASSSNPSGTTGSPTQWAGSARADNAAMESFFSLLQKNVLYRQRWLSRLDLRLAITTWIERT